jgi:diguanylate cyclase (GGDEF)-like protein
MIDQETGAQTAPQEADPTEADVAPPTVEADAAPPPSGPAAAAEDWRRPSVADVLIFRVSRGVLSLVGGSGRGAGWMGIVDLPLDGEPLVQRALGSSRPVRVDMVAEPMRVAGPYWAMHALLISVGGDHVVVFGGQQPLGEPDATLVPAAARLVAELEQVPSAKLLADELEVVQAVRDMMDWRPESLVATARDIAARAADPLSCEVGAVLVRANGELVAEVVTRDWPARLDPDAIRETLIRLFGRVEQGALLEPELEAAADDALGRNQGLVARFAVPIGRREPFGVLVVAHAATRPRGFTNLCQRIGHALADAAEPLLLQAVSREALALERDRFAHEARTDRLTGLENRAGWDELLAVEEARRGRRPQVVTIVSADLDDLKAINDREGHAAGDRVICTAAGLLRRAARASDRVARVGGDEFLVLLPETDAAGGARFVSRVRAGARRLLKDSGGLQLSLGAATGEPGESLLDTVHRADAAMYAAKTRRDRAAARESASS